MAAFKELLAKQARTQIGGPALAGRSSPTGSTRGDLHAAGFRGVDAEFCKPSGWRGVKLVGSRVDRGYLERLEVGLGLEIVTKALHRDQVRERAHRQ